MSGEQYDRKYYHNGPLKNYLSIVGGGLTVAILAWMAATLYQVSVINSGMARDVYNLDRRLSIVEDRQINITSRVRDLERIRPRVDMEVE